MDGLAGMDGLSGNGLAGTNGLAGMDGLSGNGGLATMDGGVGREQGTVKAWIEERGMGFISAPSGVDHFVHRSMLLDGQSLVIGATITFVPGWDQMKNKAIAEQVMGAVPLPSKPAQQWAAPAPGQASGQVKAWIEARGMGFIGPQDGSQDLFVHRSDLLDGQSLVVGQTVYFEASYDAMKNKPCAHKVTGAVPALGGGGAYMGDGYGKGMGDGFGKGCGKGWDKGTVTVSKDNLFIQGLPADLSEDRLWEVFGQYGQVTQAKLLPENGSPSRVALVRFAEASQADWIVANLNGNMPQGLNAVVTVEYHKSRTYEKGGYDKGGYGPAAMKGGGPMSPYGDGGKGWAQPPPPAYAAPAAPVKKDKLRVVGLPPGTNHQGIRDIMSQYGTVNHVIIKPDGAAIVHMIDEETATWIVDNLNGNIPQGLDCVIQVAYEVGAASAPPPAMAAPAMAAGGYAGPPPSLANAPAGFISGTVKHWVQERGMGFLAPDGGGEDCFVHQTNLVDGLGLVLGAPVTFMQDWDYQKNKPVATHVHGAVGGDGVGKGKGKFMEAKGKGKF